MVLQRAPQHANVWGWGVTAGATVTVTVDGQQATATADANNHWTVALPPFEAGGPYEVEVTDGATTLTLTDVLFGDVFVCAGQSNAGFPVSQAFNASAETADADRYPNIRLFQLASASASSPQDDCKPASSGQWAVNSHSTVGAFSAICYFFGRDTFVSLHEDVPIGLIASAYGGTCLEAWSSAEIVSQCTTQASSQCYTSTSAITKYSVLYNAMLNPLIKFAITAFVWYQGENNWQDLVAVQCRMPMFVQDIRDKFARPQLPFLYVDVGPGYQALHRYAQSAALQKPLTYRALTIDIGDPASPYVWWHPRNKQAVGDRLSRIAQHVIYNESAVAYEGPKPVSLTATTSGGTTTFDLGMDSTHLQFRDTAECTECCASALDVFQVAGQPPITTLWSNATTFTMSDSQPGHITIKANLAAGQGVSLDWSTYPNCALYDTVTGLPAAPFQFFIKPSRFSEHEPPVASPRKLRRHH